MIKRTSILVFVTLFLFSIAGFSQGCRMMGKDHQGHGFMMKKKDRDFSILPKGKWWKNPKVVEELNLTDDQVNKIDSIYLNYMDKLIDLKADLQKKGLLFKSKVETPNFNRDEVLKLFDEISTLKSQVKRTLFLMMLDIRDLLTPDQRVKLRELRAKKKEMKRGMMRRMMMKRKMRMKGEK